MDSGSSWVASFRQAFVAAFDATASYAPGILFAIVVLVVGWFLARLVRILARRLVRGANRVIQSILPRSAAQTIGVPPGLTNLIGHIAFAAVFILALGMALDLAGYDAAVAWFTRVAAYLPNVIAGLVIIVLGYLLGILVRDQIALWLPDDAAAANLVLPKLGLYSVAGIALVVGLDQMGVDVRFLIALFVVVTAAASIGFATAFALGARMHVRNLIGTRAARRELTTGMVVEINGIKGTVLEVSQTYIVLDTDAGKVLVPGYMANEYAITIAAITPGRSD